MHGDPMPVRRLNQPPRASIAVPGSKSVSCRAAVLAAMAPGVSTLMGYLESDDTVALMESLCALGIDVELHPDRAVVHGGGAISSGSVGLGHGGTPARFMMAVASLADGPVTIDGSTRLRMRPMQDMVTLLGHLGVTVHGDRLPLTVEPATWNTAQVTVGATASSQFLSALLLVAPAMPDGLRLDFTDAPTSEAYLRLTIAELRAWGLEVEDALPQSVRIGAGRPAAQVRTIPADASSALFWATAAAITPGSALTLPRVAADDVQPDAAAIAVLGAMGANLEWTPTGLIVRGPDRLESVGTIDCLDMPDATPALAVACSCAAGTTRLTGLHTLRVKESDRVSTVAGELTRAGGQVEIDGDDLIVQGVDWTRITDEVEIRTWEDHRIAMALAVLGLRRGGLSIADPACTAKSYPSFWDHLERLYAPAPSGDTAHP